MATNQRMLQVDSTGASKGAVNRLSTSNTGRLADAYPGGPQYTTTPKKISSIDGNVAQENVEMTNEAYRNAYKKACMIGYSNSIHQFDKAIDMSYGTSDTAAEPTPPDRLNLVPPGFPSKTSTDIEPKQGVDGSTIAASGLGPNVNPVLTLDGVPKVDNTQMADPKPSLTTTIPSPLEATGLQVTAEDEPLTGDLGAS